MVNTHFPSAESIPHFRHLSGKRVNETGSDRALSSPPSEAPAKQKTNEQSESFISGANTSMRNGKVPLAAVQERTNVIEKSDQRICAFDSEFVPACVSGLA